MRPPRIFPGASSTVATYMGGSVGIMEMASPLWGDQQQHSSAAPAFPASPVMQSTPHMHKRQSSSDATRVAHGTLSPGEDSVATVAVRAPPRASVVHGAQDEGRLPVAFTFDQNPIGLHLHWEGDSPDKSDAGPEGVVGAVRVRAVAEGGLAQRLGIVTGWEVVRVNQEPVARLSESALMEVLHAVRPLTLWLVPPPRLMACVFDAGPTGLSLHWEQDNHDHAGAQSAGALGVVRVQSIKHGGLADTLGVRSGWELMQIDETPVANLCEEDFIDLLSDRPATLFFLPTAARIEASAKRLSTMAELLRSHASHPPAPEPDSGSGSLVAFQFDESPTGLKLGWEQSCVIASRQPCCI